MKNDIIVSAMNEARRMWRAAKKPKLEADMSCEFVFDGKNGDEKKPAARLHLNIKTAVLYFVLALILLDAACTLMKKIIF